MHLPDGFIAPSSYLPATLLALATGAWAVRGWRAQLAQAPEHLPRLAMVTALCYGLGLIMLPLPGGTSAHPLGIGALTLLFGVRTAYLAYALVLLLQALLFGAGGVTALGVNALCIGLVGAVTCAASHRLLAPWFALLAAALASGMAVLAAATATALVLGLQPVLAHDAQGQPLYFPFGIAVTLPALILPHALLAIGEGALTQALWRHAQRRGWR